MPPVAMIQRELWIALHRLVRSGLRLSITLAIACMAAGAGWCVVAVTGLMVPDESRIYDIIKLVSYVAAGGGAVVVLVYGIWDSINDAIQSMRSLQAEDRHYDAR